MVLYSFMLEYEHSEWVFTRKKRLKSRKPIGAGSRSFTRGVRRKITANGFKRLKTQKRGTGHLQCSLRQMRDYSQYLRSSKFFSSTYSSVVRAAGLSSVKGPYLGSIPPWCHQPLAIPSFTAFCMCVCVLLPSLPPSLPWGLLFFLSAWSPRMILVFKLLLFCNDH